MPSLLTSGEFWMVTRPRRKGSPELDMTLAADYSSYACIGPLGRTASLRWQSKH